MIVWYANLFYEQLWDGADKQTNKHMFK